MIFVVVLHMASYCNHISRVYSAAFQKDYLSDVTMRSQIERINGLLLIRIGVFYLRTSIT